MSEPLVLTGLSHGKHKFSLTYPEVESKKVCIAICECGYEIEIINFHNYGGVKDLQIVCNAASWSMIIFKQTLVGLVA